MGETEKPASATIGVSGEALAAPRRLYLSSLQEDTAVLVCVSIFAFLLVFSLLCFFFHDSVHKKEATQEESIEKGAEKGEMTGDTALAVPAEVVVEAQSDCNESTSSGSKMVPVNYQVMSFGAGGGKGNLAWSHRRRASPGNPDGSESQAYHWNCVPTVIDENGAVITLWEQDWVQQMATPAPSCRSTRSGGSAGSSRSSRSSGSRSYELQIQVEGCPLPAQMPPWMPESLCCFVNYDKPPPKPLSKEEPPAKEERTKELLLQRLKALLQQREQEEKQNEEDEQQQSQEQPDAEKVAHCPMEAINSPDRGAVDAIADD